ncbi:hypothetical protein JMM63_21435 [Rhodovulum sulfidophilum]|uniref:hypothetical protein n=1 Tax=Rhodovulum sulfidophilum TaxID=35806 RepID=UPI0019250655|nr:hypothetical protein [Rhodovulum sulfidophilum]MBL3598075.1 hypothetical protein [Rhodovulum sulfidophilum]
MLAFDWNFLRKLRTGISEPIYENFVMKMLTITKIKARPFQFLGSVGKDWAGRIGFVAHIGDEDSPREASALDRCHAEALSYPLSHDELVRI